MKSNIRVSNSKTGLERTRGDDGVVLLPLSLDSGSLPVDAAAAVDDVGRFVDVVVVLVVALATVALRSSILSMASLFLLPVVWGRTGVAAAEAAAAELAVPD